MFLILKKCLFVRLQILKNSVQDMVGRAKAVVFWLL